MKVNLITTGMHFCQMYFQLHCDCSVVLNKVSADCCAAGLIINHLIYADLVVFVPLAKGLQKFM